MNPLPAGECHTGRQTHTLLTVFMSTAMLVCEDVWLSGIGQGLTEAEAWTRGVC